MKPLFFTYGQILSSRVETFSGAKALSAPSATAMACALFLMGSFGGALPAHGQTSTLVSQYEADGASVEAASLVKRSRATLPRQRVEDRPAYRRPVTVDLEEVTLKEALRHIAQKAGLRLSYGSEATAKKDKVTLYLERVAALDAIRAALQGLRMEAVPSSSGQLVVIRPRRAKAEPLAPGGLPSLQRVKAALPAALTAGEPMQGVIAGTVTSDATGEALPGVNILIEGTQLGAATDADGTYEITGVEPGTYTVRASFIGYGDEVEEGVEVSEGETTTVDIAMQQEAQGLDEVVVVGYGTQRRADLTGAISSVETAEIESRPVNGIDQALQGKAAGVRVTQNSGNPGGGVSVRIRGMGSLGGSQPLFVVDGIPIDRSGDGHGNPLNTINPSTVESIEVLKDASAAAIYGSRAANGVVLIQTKTGRSGDTRVNFRSYYGSQTPQEFVDLTEPGEWAEYIRDAHQNAGFALPSPAFSNPDSVGQVYGSGTNWQDELFGAAPVQNYELSVTGGNETTQFALTGGVKDQRGIFLETGFRRYSLSLNAERAASGVARFGTHLKLARTAQERGRFDEEFYGITNAFRMPPTVPVRMNGSYFGPTGQDVFLGGAQNEVAFARQRSHDVGHNSILGDVYGEYDLLANLTFRTQFGFDYLTSRVKEFWPTFQHGGKSSSNDRLQESINENFTWTSESTLQYDTLLRDTHQLSALAGFSVQKATFSGVQGTVRNFPGSAESIQYLSNGSQGADVSGGAGQWGLLSYYGRFNYSYDSRYLFTSNLRIDGSSRFGPNNRYGVFPSFSAAWRLSEEAFMSDVGFVDNLKIRGSWGQLGNQQIGLFAYQTTLNTGLEYFFGSGQTRTQGIAPTSGANPDVQWETTTQTDVGVDVTMFDSRLSFTADYFIKDTDDILVSLPIPATAGRGAAPVNAGSMRNRGIELSADYSGSIGDFTYNIGGNFTKTENEVVSLGGGEPIMGPSIRGNRFTRTEEGRPIGSFYGYVTDGIFQTQEEVNSHATQPGAAPGDIRFEDVNGDGVVDSADRTYIGSPLPDFEYGMTLDATYKGFDFYMAAQGVQGADIYNMGRIWTEGMTDVYNKSERITDRWTGPGTSQTIPRAVVNDPNDNIRPSDRWVEDGSYLRIQSMQLGYTLPSSLTSMAGLRSLRLYANVENPFTFTDYRGLDPEIGLRAGNPFINQIDRGNYPVAQTYTVGINIGF